MAKQTFTTGQVLTAGQMTSLQQTAMGGGEATAKTASYVLVAADAGTTVIMNAAGATTITVNTALFAAGDTVNIQNIGAGVCTITNGTATVSTAGSLALSQWEGGVLYFRSTSTATFFDYVQTGAVSPLTTKGDVWGYSTLDARIPVGANNTVLTADSAQALGVKWATPSSTASGCYVYMSSSQSIATGTNTTLNWNSESFDTDSYHSTSVNTNRLTVPSAGKYLITGVITWGSSSAGTYRNVYLVNAAGAYLYMNNSRPAATYQQTSSFATTVNAAAADYFYLNCEQDSGGNLNIQSQLGYGGAEFGIMRLGS